MRPWAVAAVPPRRRAGSCAVEPRLAITASAVYGCFVKATTAAKHLIVALRDGSVRFTAHAMDMIEAADLALVLVTHDLAYAATREVAPSRSHPGRFVAHGRRLIFVFEVVAPNVVIVTTFPKEWGSSFQNINNFGAGYFKLSGN